MSLSVGAEAAIVAVITSFMLLSEKGDRDANCNGAGICSATGYESNDTLKQILPWNTGAWIAGIAALGAGTTLLILDPADRRQTVAVGVWPTGGGAAAGLRTTF